MKNVKDNKGITLIALIITIIVMMILVGVTVVTVLKGDLFNSAHTATQGTEKHAIYDQIVGTMILTENAEIDVDKTYDAAKAMLEDDGKAVGTLGADGTFTVTGKRGTYTYKITGTKIEIAGEKDDGPTGVLQYGKMYKGLLIADGESMEVGYAFSNKYNKVFSIPVYDNTVPKDFQYNQEDSTVNVGGMEFDLSEDGENLSTSFESDGMSISIDLELSEEEYIITAEKNSEVDIVDGLYYNSTKNKFIKIEVDEENPGATVTCEEGFDGGQGSSGSGTPAEHLNSALSKYDVTIVDTKNLERDGYVYTLVQGNIIEENNDYYDIAFDVDLSTSGYENIATTNANKVFAFETLYGTKGVIMLSSDGNLVYYTDIILDVSKYSYTYFSSTGWKFLKTMTDENPVQVSTARIITDETEMENILKSVASGGQIDYEFSIMTNEEISKIVTLTKHQ